LALKYVDDLRESQAASRKGARIASRGKKVQDEFEAEAQYIKAAMAALGVQSPEEIIEALSLKAKLNARVTELRQQLAKAEQSPEYRAAVAGEQKLRKQLDSLSAELAQKGAYVRDPGEVEREISRLKQSLAAPKPAAVPVEDVPGAVPSPSMPAEDPFPALVATAADLLGMDPNAVVASLRDRCLQYFAALTDHRYSGLEFEKDFRAVAVGGNQRLPANSLPSADQDMLYLAGRLTLVEKHSGRAKVPLLVEDVGTLFDEARLMLLGRMLKRLGAMTQVIHVAAQPALTSAAEAVVNL